MDLQEENHLCALFKTLVELISIYLRDSKLNLSKTQEHLEDDLLKLFKTNSTFFRLEAWCFVQFNDTHSTGDFHFNSMSTSHM